MNSRKLWDPGSATRGEPHTRWTNPLEVEQRVTVHVPTTRKLVDRDGAPTGPSVEGNDEVIIIWKPGETREIPSSFDRVIHTVISCGHGGDCSRAGVCCDAGNAGPNALLMGGAAPALVRDDMKYQVEPGLLAHLRATSAPVDLARRREVRRESDKGRPT